MTRKIIGYAPIYETEPGAIVTQAFILCSRCNAAISAHGGPRYGSLCLKCVKPFARITHVAIWHKEHLIGLRAPKRHHDIINDPETPPEVAMHGIQGFLTDEGTFLPRREAFVLAERNGQLNRRPGGYDGPELFSEDLW